MTVNGNKTPLDFDLEETGIPLLEQVKAAAASAGRIFLAAALAAYMATGEPILPVTEQGLQNAGAAGLAALSLTVLNWLRSGESRFGTDTPESDEE